MNLVKQKDLESGKHYWIMINPYHDWKLGYVGQDSDDNLWLHLIGVANPIEAIHLTECTAIEIEPPPSMRRPLPSERTPGEITFTWLEDETNLIKRDGLIP